MKYPNNPIHKLKSLDESINLILEKDEPLNDLPTIPEFYAGKEIFITGGSGFLGKVLIEKLLRSCPDIKAIYVLLRPKRGKLIDERLKEITDLVLFDVLRKLNREFQNKLIPVAGDVSEINLGMCEIDIKRMKNVSIIFHSAASVRFDDSLKYAVMMNTRGTREVMKFAEGLKDLKVLLHVSTTYSNVYRHTLEESIYPPAADWQKTIEICEKLDDDQLNLVTPHYINFMPNTYTFTKNLAEHVVNDYKNKLPLVLFRPSIVISAIKEPLPGWIDNFNGPMGILLASILGLSHTMYCDPENVMDFIPVDVCCNALIIAAWKRAHEPKSILPVYNCASGNDLKMTVKQLLDIGITGVCAEIPMDHMIWKADGGVTLCKTWNLMRLLQSQIIPSLILDTMLKLKGKRPKLLKIQRKMYEANKALSYFVTHNWDFKNKNFFKLCSYLRNGDSKNFDYRFIKSHDVLLNVRQSIMGYRRYLLKEKDETLPKARQMYNRLKLVDDVMSFIPYIVASYIAFVKYDLLRIVNSYFVSSN